MIIISDMIPFVLLQKNDERPVKPEWYDQNISFEGILACFKICCVISGLIVLQVDHFCMFFVFCPECPFLKYTASNAAYFLTGACLCRH